MPKLARMTITNAVGDGVIPEWTIGDRFRKAREMRGLSQSEFAVEVSLSRRTISALEAGEKKPLDRDYKLYQLATRVPREWLEFGVRPPGLEPGTHCIRVGDEAIVTPLRSSTSAIAA